MKSKALYYLSMHVLVASLLLILSGFYILFYPFEPVTFRVNPFQTDKKVYVQGETVLYTLDFEKHMNLKPVITYYLTDGVVYPLSKAGISRPVGKQVRNLSIQIPDGVPPGVYRIQIDFDYTIYFRHIYRTWQSEEFYIIRKAVNE